MDWDYLRHCVYSDGALDGRFDPLPGRGLTTALDLSELDPENWLRTGRKIEHSIRKLLAMWMAGDKALEAEREFYATTIEEAPALLGRDAVEVQYHCEAMIFFARSSLDLAAYAFAQLLPPGLQPKRTDSFNDLLKSIVKSQGHNALVELVESWRNDETGWLPLVAEIEKGRSLRDQIAHQIGFPLAYRDISLASDKRTAVVTVGDNPPVELGALVERLRTGVTGAFIHLEKVCEAYHREASVFLCENESDQRPELIMGAMHCRKRTEYAEAKARSI